MKRRICILTALFILLGLFQATAGDPAGWWTSSSGSSVKIWANMQQVIVTIYAAGSNKGYKYYGWWDRFSDYFSYQVKTGRNAGVRKCWFDSRNSNIIHVKDPWGKMYTWTRGRQQSSGYSNRGYTRQNLGGTSLDPKSWNDQIKRNQNSNAPAYNTTVPTPTPPMDARTWNNNINRNRSVSINGVWKSSSGSSFQISSEGNTIYINIVAANGSRMQGVGRWLKYGSKFDYSVQGYPGVGVCNISSQNPNVIFVSYNGRQTTWTRR